MGGGASWKLAKKIFTLQRCGGSLCLTQQQTPVSRDSRNYSLENQKRIDLSSEIAELGTSTPSSTSNNKNNKCAICLEGLKYKSGSKAIFTAQCSHAFHLACITSNVRHGSLTCPICRAPWTQLPRPRRNPCPLHNRRTSFLRRPAQDHDPIDPPRLSFSLLTSSGSSVGDYYNYYYYYLRLTLSHPPPTDLVLVASPCGSGLTKQAMALVVSSLRPVDRLSIVTSPSPPHARRLRRMTPHGKTVALKIIDQMLSLRPQDDDDDDDYDLEKIFGDRAHANPRSCVLHLTTDNPPLLLTSPPYYYNRFNVPVTIHRFNVGACDGYEFEGFLARTLGGRAEDIQMRIGDTVVRIGEMRGGEERNIRLCGGVGESGRVRVKYSYRDGRDGECTVRTGDVVVVVVEDKGDGW